MVISSIAGELTYRYQVIQLGAYKDQSDSL
jgi:hypothetical protein